MVCIYDTGFTQMKRSNAREVTLRAVLEMLFMFQPFGLVLFINNIALYI